MNNKPIVLIVLDGWGFSENEENNAIAQANTPFFDELWKNQPHSLLKASGEAVGLPDGQMGNSEVGHITIGAGKTLDTDLVRISKDVSTNEMKNNPAFIDLFEHVKKFDSTLHLAGLIGTGGVHAHEDHLFGILKAAKYHGIKKVAIHAFTDGRDTPPQSSDIFLKNIEEEIEKIGLGFIATASGRFYAMDRDKNWDRIGKVEKALFDGVNNEKKETQKPSEVLKQLYKQNVLDEHLEPIVFLDQNNKHYSIEKNDGVIFFNFRADRSRQLSHKIAQRKSDLNIFFVTLTQYDPKIDSTIGYHPQNIETTLAAEISKAGYTQAHIAETEKFAHATYYLNGGQEEPHELEQHILIESRKDISTHDQAPKMKAKEITDKAIECIENKIPFIFVNLANPDMVGHTGNKEALIEAIEETDLQLERIVGAVQKTKGIAFVTADHGNAEITVDKDGNPHTAHSTNDVPAILIGGGNLKLKQSGTLADITPSILELMKIAQPETMTGTSLLLAERQ